MPAFIAHRHFDEHVADGLKVEARAGDAIVTGNLDAVRALRRFGMRETADVEGRKVVGVIHERSAEVKVKLFGGA